MTLKLYIEPEAQAELERAADRYEASVPGLGLEFLAEMRKRTQAVLDAPHRFPPFGSVEGVQCAHAVGRFPRLHAPATASGLLGTPSANATALSGDVAATRGRRKEHRP